VILADTSVWLRHFRIGEPMLQSLLDQGEVLMHPTVLGEIAVGNVSRRDHALAWLAGLPRAATASDAEALTFIETERLFGLGMGYADVQLLAAARLTSHALLWSYDRRLSDAAERLGLAARL
jgi:predicted nucleic acid-binding protein